MERIEVGVLGATGTVGRRLVRMLQGHPWFQLAELGAAPGSAGRAYGDAAPEMADGLPDTIADLPLKAPTESWSSPVLLSALPSAAAGPVEAELAGRGHLVVSNASSHRMDPDVPLIIPEVNPDHVGMVERQKRRWPGALITNPNCSVVGLALAIAPLHRAFTVEKILVTTLQSLSGAGRRGLTAADLADNTVPFIAGEEEKLRSEPGKILGAVRDGAFVPAGFAVSAQTHRVPVTHGHMLAVSLQLGERATPEEVGDALGRFTGPRGEPALPSAPERPIRVMGEEARPQPRLDRDRDDGMTVSVGRVRRCEVLDIKFSVLVHNLVRGAAGAALLNAELCHASGVTSGAGARR